MQPANVRGHRPHSAQPLPWYRYPWPWVAIAIPAIAVIGGLLTLYLAVTHPDPLVVDERQYQELRSELGAQPAAASGVAARETVHDARNDQAPNSQDGDR
jgi:hypothetical protein